ncbi:hypothetical protein GQR60_02440 [Labilibaculum sp. A4]|uniref:hypothetical protein n=1 Tax=Labilibaculum euxinus TaxID=2686357 RepID=UPI000F61C62F|nr:hypothetical protein [Labilibaculum euxinus]MDQ1770593.1 hypothetical protein [Labilibaculum euxinus]MWN75188.1 hypothetical protein [Labilibaculum euxinus]
MKRIEIIYIGLFVLLTSLGMVSCTQDTYDDQEHVTEQMIDVRFSVDEISANRYQITTNSNKYVISNYWDLGDGTGFSTGGNSFELFLPDAGEYEIKHKVIVAGGILSSEASSVVNVETSDPISGNLIRGGKFTSEDDIAEWTIGGTGAGNGTWNFNDGNANLTTPSWGGNGIYQAIQVEEGRSYQIDMYISSTTGCSDTWFEVYCGYSDPETVSGDYNEGEKLLSINTWDGSGTTPFAGKFTKVGSSTETNGVFTAATAGTVYLVIRGGGGDMKEGITIDNVEIRSIQ